MSRAIHRTHVILRSLFALPSFSFRTKLDEGPFYVRYKNGGSSSLVRRKSGFTRESHRTCMGIKEKSPSAVSLQQKGDVHKYKSIYLPNILVMIKQ